MIPEYKGVDYTGIKIGQWTVLSFSHKNKHGHKYWNLRCTCGLEASRLAANLFRKHTQSCNKCYGKRISKDKHYHWSGHENITGTYLCQTRASAAVRGMTVEVSPEFLNSIWTGTCVLSGMPISFKDRTASLDRIDSSLGYTEDNVQWVHRDVNMIKKEYPQQYFISLCTNIVNHLAEKYGSTKA